MKSLAEMDDAQLQDVTAQGKHMLFFDAAWCGDCRFIKQQMPAIEKEYSDWQFVEIDRDKFLDLAKDMDVFGIPSFIAVKDGKELGRFVNKDRKTKKQIEAFIDNLPA